MSVDAKKYVEDLMAKARAAQKLIEFKSQAEVDDICARLTRSGTTDAFAKKIAELAVEESRMGNVPSKIGKMMVKVKGVYAQLKDAKTVGIIERDEAKGLVKIAKPVGVIGALIPVTNCEATPFGKAISAIKTRNAIILAPHPRSVKTGKLAADRMREVLKRHGWPVDLVQTLEEISVEISGELMAQSDLILATGGTPMVRAAYSSGKPALGVGTGNAVTVVDTTADTDEVADKIMRSNTFDFGTSCSTENECLVPESMAEQMKASFEKVGGYIVPADEKQKFQDAYWPDGVHLNKDIVAQSPERIAELAGVKLPEGKTFFVVEETGIGAGFPFSGEKLSACLAMYTYKEFDQAIEMVNEITTALGAGHSCGIHTTDEAKAIKLGEAVKVARVMVNQPQALANSGAWTNGMPMSLTLGCGTWGGNSVSENVGYKHLMNTTWVSWPIPSTEPALEDLFSKEVLDEVWD
ncbi:MAG: aldehyde dehydrogenase [Spirochaetes bacterium]|nr:MAG: aldehyde dehydrogenase [Spirochaetota bacterium]RKX86355.1 MAG: aldehyde dehydrogenase [Spirochaetota bacterium]RKX97470.1 MAG: aldehyde dehydrogenase [Spirochaetota bacterium]